MLNRMVELSEKSANGTYETTTNEAGKADLMQEPTRMQEQIVMHFKLKWILCAEIDRIAATANFNNVKLFDGDLSTKLIIV